METKLKDMYGIEINVGDNVCFTLSMRKDTKPIVKAKVTGLIHGKTAGSNYLQIEYVESHTVAWARLENKLLKKVSCDRVVKCY